MSIADRRRLPLREAKGEMSLDDYKELTEDMFEFVEHTDMNLEHLAKELRKFIDHDRGEEDTFGELYSLLIDIHIHGVEGFSVGLATDLMSKTEKYLEGMIRSLEDNVKAISVRRKELIKMGKQYGDFIDMPME